MVVEMGFFVGGEGIFCGNVCGCVKFFVYLYKVFYK